MVAWSVVGLCYCAEMICPWAKKNNSWILEFRRSCRSTVLKMTNRLITSTSYASISIISLFLLQQQSSIFTQAAKCASEATVCESWGKKYRPLPGCTEYVECEQGYIKQILSCMEGTLFDNYLQSCNWDYDTFCDIETCEPTVVPTESPTTDSPAAFPSGIPSVSPSDAPTPSPSVGPTYNFFTTMETNTMRFAFEDTILVAYNANGIKFPSTRYTYDGMIAALKEMAHAGIRSDGRHFRFYVGNQDANLQYGRTNLAAFLAMAMTESIVYDTCDEHNEDEVAGKYAISNSCGQYGRSYQDEVCTNPSEANMSCDVNVNMVVVSSSTSINQGGRPPPPLSCRPKADWSDYAGYWDSRTGQASTNPCKSLIALFFVLIGSNHRAHNALRYRCKHLRKDWHGRMLLLGERRFIDTR